MDCDGVLDWEDDSDGDEAAEPEMFASETSAGAAAPRRARKQQRRPGARARVSSRRTAADATPNAAEYAHWAAHPPEPLEDPRPSDEARRPRIPKKVRKRMRPDQSI